MTAASEPLLTRTDHGLYCAQGDFFVDPWRAVDQAVITHAHADHLAWGCRRYLASRECLPIARRRLQPGAEVGHLEYGQTIDIGGVKISLHPAGHIRGSAQVRLERSGQVWVVSGDYKIEPDPTCTPFEPVRCHVFISECTFGLPIYRWPEPIQVFQEILAWWQSNQQAGRASLLLGYSLGKAQRLLAGLAATSGSAEGANLPGPIYIHGAIEPLNDAYREGGFVLPHTRRVAEAEKGTDWSRALILAPPSAHGTPWTRRLGAHSTAQASGWMRIRGTRRRRAIDRGFVLSDHVDWPGLLSAIDATAAETVLLTHGYTAAVVRWLQEQGRDAHALATRYQGEHDDAEELIPALDVQPKPDNQLHGDSASPAGKVT